MSVVKHSLVIDGLKNINIHSVVKSATEHGKEKKDIKRGVEYLSNITLV